MKLERDCEDCQRILGDLDHAETEAWNALARYKFMMFGYWCAVWVHLNRTAKARAPNPWKSLVQQAREAQAGQ